MYLAPASTFRSVLSKLREKWHGDLDGIATRRFLRILVASLVGSSQRRQTLVDFSDPLYEDAKSIIVGGPGAPPI